MNFVELVRRVRRESGRSGSGPAALSVASTEDLRIADWVNDAWSEIQRAPRNWRWMRRSTTSALPAQMSHTVASLGASRFGRFIPEGGDYRMRAFAAAAPTVEWDLQWLGTDEFRRRFMSGNTSTGKPVFWAVDHDGSLLLGPTPDEACTVRYDYKVSPQSLSVDADVPEMPTEFHLAIAWRALLECATNDAAPEVYARAQTRFEDVENGLIDDQGQKLEITALPLA